jgi:hypothetical protein
MNKSSKGLFDPKTAFFSLPIVIWTIGIGLASIAIACLLITYYSNREIELSAEGFNELLKIMKFPIFILGFFAALLALYATNHRSEQNKAAMEIAASQNRFSNYYKHIEEYKNYIHSNLEKYFEDYKPNINIRKLHKSLYGNAKNNGIIFSSKIELEIFKVAFKFITSLSKTNFRDEENIENLILNIDDCITSIHSLLDSIKFSPESNVTNYFTDTRTIKIPNARLKDYLKNSLKKIEIVNDTLTFEENFNSQLLESLIFHIRDAINNLPEICVAGRKNIEWRAQDNSNIDIEISKTHQQMTDLQIFLNDIKERHPQYNTEP